MRAGDIWRQTSAHFNKRSSSVYGEQCSWKSLAGRRCQSGGGEMWYRGNSRRWLSFSRWLPQPILIFSLILFTFLTVKIKTYHLFFMIVWETEWYVIIILLLGIVNASSNVTWQMWPSNTKFIIFALYLIVQYQAEQETNQMFPAQESNYTKNI